MKRLAMVLVTALVTLVVHDLLAGEPPVVFRDVIVTDTLILEREPDTVRTFVDRLVYRQSQPIQVATAPRAAVQVVNEFCAPVVVADSVRPTARPMLALRSGSHRSGSWWNPVARDELTLTGFTNYGDLRQADHAVRSGFEFRAVGDSLLVQYPRVAVIGDVVDLLGRGALVYLGVRLTSSLINQE